MTDSASSVLNQKPSAPADSFLYHTPEPASAIPLPIRAEQAIFTSVRSATASGYRLVAASPGVDAAERQELTQRCPSHASLTSEAPAAEALAAWRMRSGRHCVVWSRHAGIEHTARGGYRVHSHIVILKDADYQRFQYNPARVHVAVLETLDAEPPSAPPPVLALLLLPDPAASESTWFSAVGIGCKSDVVFALVERVLTGQDIITTSVASPLPTLDAVLAALPLAARPALSASLGLRFSPSREARLTFLDKPSDQARQLTRGKRVEWIDASDCAAAPGDSDGPRGARPPGTGPNDTQNSAWLALMRAWWTTGRRREFCRLAARVTEDPTGDALNRLARICNDLEAMNNPIGIADLAQRYGAFEPRTTLESELAAPLIELARHHALLSAQP